MTSPLAARCCHGSCHAHHRTISHAPDTGDTQCGWWQQSGGTAALAAAFPGTTAVPGCQVSRHWPASLGHHTTNCTVYSTSTQNRKPLIIIYYKIFLFPRNKEAFPKYQQLHLSTVNCSSSLPQSSHHSDHSPCGKPWIIQILRWRCKPSVGGKKCSLQGKLSKLSIIRNSTCHIRNPKAMKH